MTFIFDLIAAPSELRKARDDINNLVTKVAWYQRAAAIKANECDILRGQLAAEQQSWMASQALLQDRLAVYESWYADDRRKGTV